MSNIMHPDISKLSDKQLALEYNYLSMKHIPQLIKELEMRLSMPILWINDRIPTWKICDDLKSAVERLTAIAEEVDHRIVPF